MASRKNTEVAVDDFHRDLDAELTELRTKRKKLTAGGKTWTVRLPEEMSIIDQDILRVLMEEQQDIALDKDLSRKERKVRLRDIEDGFIELALGVDDVPDDLEPEQRAMIVRHFTAGLREYALTSPNWLLPMANQITLEFHRKSQQEAAAAAAKIRELNQRRNAQPDGDESPTNDNENEKQDTTSSSPIAAD